MRKRERDGKEKWRIWFVRERERKKERKIRKKKRHCKKERNTERYRE